MKKLIVILSLLVALWCPISAFGQGTDVVFQVDESGSMGGVITAIKNNVNTIASSLPPGFRAAAVGFGYSNNSGTHSGVVPHAHCSLIDLDTNLAGFQTCVNELVAFGSVEPGYDAIKQSADGTLGIVFSGSSFCSILFADEPNNGTATSAQDAIDALTAAGGVFFGVTPPGIVTTSYQPIADATGGMMFDMGMFTSDPTPVLEAILGACEIVLQGSEFLFYKMKTKTYHHLDWKSSNITLRDQFNKGNEPEHFIVKSAIELGNPTNLEDEEIPGSENHYVAYRVFPNFVKNAIKGKGKFFGKLPRVKVMNPDDSMNSLFEEMTLDLWHPPVRLLISSAKSQDGPVEPLENSRDALQCYGVKKASGFKKQGVSVVDQFGGPKDLKLLWPKHYCTPTALNETEIQDENQRLVCFTATSKKLGLFKGHGKQKAQEVYTNNEFGPLEGKALYETEVCIPAVEMPDMPASAAPEALSPADAAQQ